MDRLSSDSGLSGHTVPEGLRVRSLHLERRGFALSIEDLACTRGITALVGPNGAGKTSFFSVLSGRSLGGALSAHLDGAPLLPSNASLLPQSPSLPLDLRSAEFLAHVAWLGGMNRPEARARANEVLDEVDLADHAEHRIKELSGGMRRRLAFAASIAIPRGLLLLDEPTNDLDPHQRRQLLDLVRTASEDRTVLVSTHALRDVASVAEHVIVLLDGRILWSGTMAAFLAAHAPDTADAEDAYTRCVDAAKAVG